MSISLGEYIYTVGVDDTQFQTGMTNVSKSLKSFSDKSTAVGKSLTKNLTLPILAVGAATVKLAADFEVSSKKFSTAFKGAEVEASKAVENLNENFALSNSEATKLLANTGDLLKGFGATSQEALNLANSTQEVAAALAAYNGVPVKQASEAVTKALLGERESVKLLGAVVSEAAVQKQLLADGTAELVGQELLLAKAQATLKIITQQSADAVASYSENQDTLSVQTAKLIGDMKDLGVELGTILLPIMKDVVGGISEVVDWFSDLDDSAKTTIITTTGLVAAAGPLVLAIGQITTALAFLAANPVVLAIAGITALTVLVVALGEKRKRDNIESLSNEFGELAENTGVANEEMEEFLLTADAAQSALERGDYMATFEGVSYQVEQLRQNLGLTVEQLVEAGLQSDNISDNMREILTSIGEQDRVLNESLKKELDRAVTISGQKKNIEKILEVEEDVTEELETQDRLRKQIEGVYQSAWEEYKQIIEGSKTEIQLLDEQIARYEKLGNASAEYNEDQQAAIKILEDERMRILDENTLRIKEARDLELEEQQLRIDAELAAVQAAKDEELRIEKQFEDDRAALIDLRLTQTAAYFNSTAQLFNNLVQIQLEGNETLTEDQKKNIETLFRFQQAASIAQVLMDSAVAVFRQYKDLPIWLAIPASIATATLAATQVALISKQKVPELAEGGVLSATPGGRTVKVAEAGSDEAVIPLNDKFFNNFREKVIGSSIGSVGTEDSSVGQPVVIQNVLDGKLLSQSVVGYVNNNTPGTQIRSTAIVSK